VFFKNKRWTIRWTIAFRKDGNCGSLEIIGLWEQQYMGLLEA